MATEYYDASELDDLAMDLYNMAERIIPKEKDKFLRREGNKLKSIVKARYKTETTKRTGNLLEGIKRGKAYTFEGERHLRVYAGEPAYHAHLLEKGHEIVGRNNVDTGKSTDALNIFEKENENYETNFIRNTNQWLDEVLDEGAL